MKQIERNDSVAQSADVVAQNIEALKILFPDAVAEGKIDLAVIKELIGESLLPEEERDEKYGLNWFGKRKARQIALTPSTGTLRPCPEDSVDWDTTKNLMIEGDNLEVLKLLQKSYAGKVKLIYIDPPYNTGKDFVYPDNFQDNIKNYLELTGQIEGGTKMQANTESSGRYHTDWLNMMYPRLRLARGLLANDGFIGVSIDNSEYRNICLLLDDIFGEECYLGTVVRATGTTTGQDSGGLGQSFDYIVFYTKTPDTMIEGIPLDDDDEKRFQDEDDKGKYSVLQLRKTGNSDRREDRPSMYYGITSPDNSVVYPIGPSGYESRWRFGMDKYKESLENDLIVWKQVDKQGSLQWQPYVKFYLEGRTKRPSPLWDDIDGNKKATIELKELVGEKVFSNPKPLQMMKKIFQVTLSENTSSIILDFFAGSGTSGHALYSWNSTLTKNNRYILVQLPEPISEQEKEQKLAVDFCKQNHKPLNIAEITKERLRRAGKKIKEENPMFTGDTGFRVFKLDTSNIRPWEPDWDNLDEMVKHSVNHIKDGRSEADILYELLLKLGLDLSVPIEEKTIGKKKVQAIGAGTLMVCLDKSISRADAEPLALGIAEWHKQLAPVGETTCVFLDSAFADDVAKSNLSAILQQHGLENVRSL